MLDADVDVLKFAERLVKAGREGIAWERRKLQWILEEKERAEKSQSSKDEDD